VCLKLDRQFGKPKWLTNFECNITAEIIGIQKIHYKHSQIVIKKKEFEKIKADT